jgi:hypothetical protein
MMKKRYLFFVLMLCIAAIGVKAQNFTFKNASDEALSDTMTIAIDQEGGTSYDFIHFTNISGVAKTVKVKLDNMSLANGAALQMCFNGNCLPNVTLSPSSITIENDSTYKGFDLVYDYADGTTSILRINLVAADDTSSVYQSLYVKYAPESSLERPNEKQSALSLNVDAFPNPTSNNVTVKYSLPANYSNGKITIRNMIGRTLKSIAIKGGTSGKHVISTTDLPSGVYFYSIMGNGKTLSTKKLVVKH